MANIKIYNVDSLGKPVGPYSHVARVKSAEALYRQELRGRDIPRVQRAPEMLDADPARNSSAALERFGAEIIRGHVTSL